MAGLVVGVIVNFYLSTGAPMLPDAIGLDLVPSSVCPEGSELSNVVTERRTEDGYSINVGWECIRLRPRRDLVERDVLRTEVVEEYLPTEGSPTLWLFAIYFVPLVGGVIALFLLIARGFGCLERRSHGDD